MVTFEWKSEESFIIKNESHNALGDNGYLIVMFNKARYTIHFEVKSSQREKVCEK